MVEQTIRDNTKGYVEAYNRGDVAAAADFYTEDAKVLANNMEMVSGRQAIREFWKTAMEMGVKKMNLQTVEVGYDGNLAYERGVSIVDIEPKGGQARTEKGKYLTVLKRQPDGSWKVAVDIWNSDSPAQRSQ